MLYLFIQTGIIIACFAEEQMLGIYFVNLRFWRASDCENMYGVCAAVDRQVLDQQINSGTLFFLLVTRYEIADD